MAEQSAQELDGARRSRRLSDKIEAAFEHACQEGELTVAAELLDVLEAVLLKNDVRPDRRETVISPLVALHEILWRLRTQAESHDTATREAS